MASVRRAAVPLAVLAILASAAVHRFAGADRLLWGSDELGNLFAGIRLHLLPWWNLADPVRDNFFKSLVMPVHGFVDTLFFYAVVGVFRLLNVPVTEQHLFQAGAVLSLATLGLGFVFVRRFFGAAPALVVLALMAWNPLLIFFSTSGYQLNFTLFVQLAVLSGYALHVVKNRWGWSWLASGLMLLCGGSELFYLAPVLVLLHVACLRQARQDGLAAVRLAEPKNLLVWGAYGLMMIMNLALYAIIGHRLDLTLFGRVFRKRAIELAHHAHYDVGSLLRAWDAVMPSVPAFAALACAAAAALLVWRTRKQPMALFAVGYLALLAVLLYNMRMVHPFNMVHLFLPSAIVIGVALTAAVRWGLSRMAGDRPWLPELAGLLSVALLVPFAAPWKPVDRPASPPPEAYRCIKAVGYALRELGAAPPRRVMFLTNHHSVPTTMEYYAGLGASGGDDAPTHLFYVHQLTDEYLPSRIAQRQRLERFDYYVEFPKASFPEQERFLGDVAALRLPVVAEVVAGEEVHARIYSPHPVPKPLRISIEDGNRGFDQRYARWPRLFHDRHAGAFYYFGAGY